MVIDQFFYSFSNLLWINTSGKYNKNKWLEKWNKKHLRFYLLFMIIFNRHKTALWNCYKSFWTLALLCVWWWTACGGSGHGWAPWDSRWLGGFRTSHCSSTPACPSIQESGTASPTAAEREQNSLFPPPLGQGRSREGLASEPSQPNAGWG